MQHLNVQLSIPIPEDSIIITKVEFLKLKECELAGVYWGAKDLEKRTGRRMDWLKENILYPSRFRKILDVEHGGFVSYPKVQGQAWAFQASKMAAFLDKYFNLIFGAKEELP
ncbi:DUF771 domain-containing protein [Paenibacillus alvei]|uniref:DUF771 domain-containing protein n=1 Tax=Paenibacillus alvei TaxID=44250 RepID=UPI0002897BD8|nr:DUF771 domain-containing protein [Paenibacillus alvei]EJW16969.1 hypothetical protein PAV_4c00470 [Paenibacillus alvei DSM 29]MCY9539082.1 DUF771 domain-containing protein [Paenibacillus alvei]MCY9707993.1 DUF771 domain-containing protein [Paenibacillus alvei]MCY9734412.1 DUF771 domain-containing protein [Paenibacillus alvei]MCY9753590.1 DUF771 domain-containing protein [Paenibacillus alvei]